MGEQRQIFRVVEEREITPPRRIERPHIPDFRVEVDITGWCRAHSLGHGAQGKGASTLKKARMFHRILTEGDLASANDAKRRAETSP
jgi:hypothetical protein